MTLFALPKNRLIKNYAAVSNQPDTQKPNFFGTHQQTFVWLAVLGIFSLSSPTLIAQDDLSDLTPEERAFFEDDSFFETLEVQETPIKWIDPNKTHGQYALENTITILPDSVKTGVVGFTQCHLNLDEIRAIDIVYNPQTTKTLRVISTKGISQSKAFTSKIELYGVEKGAEVCIEGKNKTLEFNQTNQSWRLARGPYMRKFLDGYYPMHVAETISWPSETLNWKSTDILQEQPSLKSAKFTPLFSTSQPLPSNPQKPSFEINHKQGWIKSNYWFEGKLTLREQFTAKEL